MVQAGAVVVIGSVSWTEMKKATIDVREVSVTQKDQTWRMCDSALTLVESDKESRRAFLTLESSTGLRSSSACLFLKVDWHVTGSEAPRRNPI